MTFKIIATLSLVIVAVLVSDGAVVPANNHFTLLGKYTRTSTGISGHQAIQETSYYFLSQNAAGWATAAADCRANLGDTGSLVYLETDEEVAELTKYLQDSDDTGSSYWTGGKYDPTSSAFVWDNGVALTASAPWDVGHPNTQIPITRVLAYRVGGLKLRTDFNTVTFRYICELVV